MQTQIKTSDNILKLKDLLDTLELNVSKENFEIFQEKLRIIISEHTKNIFSNDSCEDKIKNYEKLVYQLNKFIIN